METCPDLFSTLKQIKSLGCWAGVVLNPETPASAIEPFLGEADLVLVMSVNPGYSGQKFMPEMISKVAEIRKHAGYHPLLRLAGSGRRHRPVRPFL